MSEPAKRPDIERLKTVPAYRDVLIAREVEGRVPIKAGELLDWIEHLENESARLEDEITRLKTEHRQELNEAIRDEQRAAQQDIRAAVEDARYDEQRRRADGY